MSKGKLRFWGLILAAVFASYYIADLRLHNNREYPEARLMDLLHMKGAKPFQYRVLIPALQAGILQTLEPRGLTPAQVFCWTDALFLFLTYLAFRKLLGLVAGPSEINGIASFGIFLVLPFHYLLFPTFYYPYDIPSVCVFTYCTALIYQKNWLLLYPVFIFGAFNRETVIFIPLLLVLTSFRRIPASSLWIHVCSLSFIWIAIKLLLFFLFLKNPGASFIETHMMLNLHKLAKLSFYPVLLSIFGFLWIPVFLWISLIQNDFIKQSLWLFPIFYIVVFATGNLDELRIFGEISGIVLAAFVLILYHYTESRELRPQTER